MAEHEQQEQQDVDLQELMEQLGAEADAQLAAMDEGAEQQEGAEEQQPQPLTFEGLAVYLDDKPVEDLRGVTLEDFLTKAVLGYKALGKEQKRNFKELLRNAQLGHFNEQQYRQTERDRDMLAEQLQQVSQQLNELQQQSQLWDAALFQASLGNPEPLQRLLAAYQEQLQQSYTQPAQQRWTPEQQELAGRQLFEKEIRPYLQDVAKQRGFGDYAKFEEYVQQRLGSIPAPLMTAERVVQYLTQGLIEELDAGLYSEGSGVEQQNGTAANAEIAALKAQLAEMQKKLQQAQLAEVPPASGPATAGSGGSGGTSQQDDMPSFEKDGEFDLDAAMKWLQDR